MQSLAPVSASATKRLHVILHHLNSLEHLLILLVSVRADYTSLRDTCGSIGLGKRSKPKKYKYFQVQVVFLQWGRVHA